MSVIVRTCAAVWLFVGGTQPTQTPIICSKPDVHHPRARCAIRLLKNTHKHSELLIHSDITHKVQTNQPRMNLKWYFTSFFVFLLFIWGTSLVLSAHHCGIFALHFPGALDKQMSRDVTPSSLDILLMEFEFQRRSFLCRSNRTGCTSCKSWVHMHGTVTIH